MQLLGVYWLAILVSAIAVFFVSSVLHMLLPIHRNDYKKLPNESDALEKLRECLAGRIAKLIEDHPHLGVNSSQVIQAELVYCRRAQVGRRAMAQRVVVVLPTHRVLPDANCPRRNGVQLLQLVAQGLVGGNDVIACGNQRPIEQRLPVGVAESGDIVKFVAKSREIGHIRRCRIRNPVDAV